MLVDKFIKALEKDRGNELKQMIFDTAGTLMDRFMMTDEQAEVTVFMMVAKSVSDQDLAQAAVASAAMDFLNK